MQLHPHNRGIAMVNTAFSRDATYEMLAQAIPVDSMMVVLSGEDAASMRLLLYILVDLKTIDIRKLPSMIFICERKFHSFERYKDFLLVGNARLWSPNLSYDLRVLIGSGMLELQSPLARITNKLEREIGRLCLKAQEVRRILTFMQKLSVLPLNKLRVASVFIYLKNILNEEGIVSFLQGCGLTKQDIYEGLKWAKNLKLTR